jgi:uroporphyrinogen-III synthase
VKKTALATKAERRSRFLPRPVLLEALHDLQAQILTIRAYCWEEAKRRRREEKNGSQDSDMAISVSSTLVRSALFVQG